MLDVGCFPRPFMHSSFCLVHSLEEDAGGSPQMVFKHYRACLAAVRRRQELVRPADAEKWFAVTLASVEAAKAAREAGAEAKIVKLPGVQAA
jgi:hypothetical protein